MSALQLMRRLGLSETQTEALNLVQGTQEAESAAHELPKPS